MDLTNDNECAVKLCDVLTKGIEKELNAENVKEIVLSIRRKKFAGRTITLLPDGEWEDNKSHHTFLNTHYLASDLAKTYLLEGFENVTLEYHSN